MVIAGTGHRPEVLGGHSEDLFRRLVEYAKLLLKSYNPITVISGMALGWDQALALAAVEIGLPLIAAVPFVGQEHVWPDASKILYYDLISKASRVEFVSEGGYASWKYLKRDQWMVDNSDGVLALWNGIKKGGTYHTVTYANSVKKPVFNVWPGWENFNEE